MMREFESPKEALKYFKKKKKELEDRMEQLIKLRDEGKITCEEFEEKKREIEREFIEVMDRIAQLSYILSQGS
ncbi:MAG: hypothetical protein DRJ51_04955 [Thermoprotei archaeon]|nr:MAG: hypothetical protein DRJ51_04955 [Thermoprotei archaeon]RLF02850.1 MAG: hypothetical protein DRJ59_02410 [Thermoprotei archaeon]